MRVYHHPVVNMACVVSLDLMVTLASASMAMLDKIVTCVRIRLK